MASTTAEFLSRLDDYAGLENRTVGDAHSVAQYVQIWVRDVAELVPQDTRLNVAELVRTLQPPPRSPQSGREAQARALTIARDMLRVLNGRLSGRYSGASPRVPMDIARDLDRDLAGANARSRASQRALRRARELAASLAYAGPEPHLTDLSKVGVIIYGYSALAMLEIEDHDLEAEIGIRPGDDPLGDASAFLTAVGYMLTPEAEFRQEYERLWTVFEIALDAGLDAETERRARWLNKTIGEWWQESADDLDLLDLLVDRLYALLPDICSRLGFQLPTSIAHAAKAGDVSTTVASVNEALELSNNALGSPRDHALAPPVEPKVARALERVNEYLDKVLPAARENTRRLDEFAGTSLGRALISATQVVAGGVTTLTAAAVSGSPQVGLSTAAGLVLARIGRTLYSKLRMRHVELPGLVGSGPVRSDLTTAHADE